jgi:hypothetical protein
MKSATLIKNVRAALDPACGKGHRLRKEANSKLEKGGSFSERIKSVWTRGRKEPRQAGFEKKDVARICKGDS